MSQIVFLDTNVILDFIENRNGEVRYIIRRLLDFHKKGKVLLATSVVNLAEIIDKEFDINFTGKLLYEKLSFDEIIKKKNNKNFYREISKENKNNIEIKIKKFIYENNIEILALENNSNFYEDLCKLIYDYQFESQDAVMITTALRSNVTYFLSNDSDIVKQITENELMDVYNLRDKNQREDFNDNVLDSLAEVLK